MTEESKPIPAPAPAEAEKPDRLTSVEIAMPGIGGELRVAMLALHLLDRRLSSDLSRGFPADINLEAYADDVMGAMVFVLAQLPRPNYDVPILLSLLRLAIGALANFGRVVNVKFDTEFEGQIDPDQPKKAYFPLDPSLRAV
jgi:hypothetical protein